MMTNLDVFRLLYMNGYLKVLFYLGLVFFVILPICYLVWTLFVMD